MVTSLTGASAWPRGPMGRALWAQAGQAPWALLFDRHGFWFLMQAILFVDVACFTLGYLVETRAWAASSARSTRRGWAGPSRWPATAVQTRSPRASSARRCRTFPLRRPPPGAEPGAAGTDGAVHLGVAGAGLESQQPDAPRHRGARALMPGCATGLHLQRTWRGGSGAVPLVLASFQQGTGMGLVAAGSMAAWSFLYVLRALTGPPAARGRRLRGLCGARAPPLHPRRDLTPWPTPASPARRVAPAWRRLLQPDLTQGAYPGTHMTLRRTLLAARGLARTYPSKPIRLVVTFPSGGA